MKSSRIVVLHAEVSATIYIVIGRKMVHKSVTSDRQTDGICFYVVLQLTEDEISMVRYYLVFNWGVNSMLSRRSN